MHGPLDRQAIIVRHRLISTFIPSAYYVLQTVTTIFKEMIKYTIDLPQTNNISHAQ